MNIENIRAVVRPVLTLAAFGVWAALAWTGRADVKDFVLVCGAVITFYVGSRSGNGKAQ